MMEQNPLPYVQSTMTMKQSRSAIETRKYCQRARYLGYHKDGTGWEKAGSKYEAEFGTILHEGMSRILLDPREDLTWEDVQGLLIDQQIALTLLVATTFYVGQSEEDKARVQTEQLWLLLGLVWGWTNKRRKQILQQFEIVSVEIEQEVTFDPEDYLPIGYSSGIRSLTLPLRLDCLLREKHSGRLYIMDFKTASQASEDWNTKLDNSLQSILYIEAVERLYKESVGGIWYEGLVKGKREMDGAQSSPFQGSIIQYGSFLYGWEKKDGTVSKTYAKGSTRVFLPKVLDYDLSFFPAFMAQMETPLESYIVSTMPWKPLNIGTTIGSVIAAEDEYQSKLDRLDHYPVGVDDRARLEAILFEPSTDNCYKYGAKHRCAFVEVCHMELHEEELRQIYQPREDHHALKERVE